MSNSLFILCSTQEKLTDQTLQILSTLDLALSPHQNVKLGHLVWSVPASQKERLTYHDIHSHGFLYFIGLPSILTIAALEPESMKRF